MREGNAFKEHGQLDEAIWAYRQAAKSGHLGGTFAVGDCLLMEGQAAKGWERVLKLSEGLAQVFYAATNHHPQACARLADALQNGIGVETNLVSAYAWLSVAAKYAPAFKADLDRLLVRLEPGDILQAQKMAREFDSG